MTNHFSCVIIFDSRYFFIIGTEVRMIFLQSNNLIEEKLFGQHESFLKYCQEAGKKVVDELDKEDFIAYRSEYAVSRKQVEQIKALLNFQEKKHDEEIYPPQNISDVPDDSLQNYFGIDDLSSYENILISEIDFNVRVQRCLKFNSYKTLADILRVSQKDFFSLRNFGQGSFDNLIAPLKKFFIPKKKVISWKTLRLANEELDEFLRNAALNHAPQIDLIIASFEEFSISVTTKNLFRDLPDDFKDKRARPFFMACGYEVDLPDDLKLDELPAYISENSLDFDNDKLKDFAKALRFDLRACTKKISDDLFKSEREFNVVCRRAKGYTLEEIGKNFGVTRERVRQIELKSVNRFMKHRVDVKKIIYFLYALTDGKSILTPEDAKNFLDTADAEILLFFIAKTNLPISGVHFDEELNAVIFADKFVFDEKVLIKNLPDIMEEKIIRVFCSIYFLNAPPTSWHATKFKIIISFLVSCNICFATILIFHARIFP